MFVDRVKVNIRAGDGGDGLTSFRREKFRARGGPDGGDGGRGGDVILRASRNQNTLAAFRYKKLLSAASGKPGARSRKHGKSGQNLEVAVPIGTTVSNNKGEMIADLTADDQTVTIARGGRGGFGNAHFTSSIRQAPRTAEIGERGEQLEAVFELKMIADVGIVGLPNAGKSTLLSVISAAKPEIAEYPFTTLTPNLGVVDINRQTSLLFADIPGLIKGASRGKGLGDEFLRHVERTNVLIHLIDIYNQDIPKAYKTIMDELAAYKVDLSHRPQIVVLTKIEGVDKKELTRHIESLKRLVPKGTQVLAISSPSGEGIKELLQVAVRQVAKAKKPHHRIKKPQLPVIRLRDQRDDWRIEKRGDEFVVTGSKIERFARQTKFGDYHSEQRLRDIMRKMGIGRELEKKGIKEDQLVIIGSPEIGQLEY